MSNELYKFLKSKGLEFCYKDKKPFLVNSFVHVDYMQEFNDQQNKEMIEVYDEYVEFLGKELSRHEAMTVVRPYMAASGEVVAKGVELRKKIELLKTNKK